VINEISIASEFLEDDTRFEGGGGLFTIRRNGRSVGDFLTVGGGILTVGDCGAEFKSYLPGAGVIAQASGEGGAPGLGKFTNSFRLLNKNSCFGAELSSAAFDGETFYFGTKGGDLIELNDRGVRHISIISVSGRYRITGLKKHGGVLLILTAGGGLYTFSNNRIFKISDRSHGLSSNDINDVDIFEKDNILYAALALSNGAEILKINDFNSNDLEKVYSYKTPSSVDTVIYSNNGIYAGGASVIDRRVYCVYYDKASDTIYFGTYRGFGEMKYAQRRLKAYFTINSALPDNWITSITDYEADNLLVATYDRGLALFNKRSGKFASFALKILCLLRW
jgi:hypothetical protein